MTTPPDVPDLRAVWLGMIVLAAIMIGTAAGWLTWLDAPSVPRAILAGAAAFAAASIFLLTLVQFLSKRR